MYVIPGTRNCSISILVVVPFKASSKFMFMNDDKKIHMVKVFCLVKFPIKIEKKNERSK